MREIEYLVLGSGVAGLGTACWLKDRGFDFTVVDACKELPKNLHNGVHYLHSIPELPFPIDLREITLTDGILVDGVIDHKTNLLYSLQYSQKVREIQHPSSIMDIGKREKVYMTKENSMNTLIDSMYEFIGKEKFEFGMWLSDLDTENKIATFKKEGGEEKIQYKRLISSVPLDKMDFKNSWIKSLRLKSNPVYITNIKVEKIVPNWLINLYVPDPSVPMYRCSILNNVCSIESVREMQDWELQECIKGLEMFHLVKGTEEKFTWNTGKIVSISRDDRETLIENLSSQGIYQIGRFGLWNRKLLVDSTINQSKRLVDYFFFSENGQMDINELARKWKETKDSLSK